MATDELSNAAGTPTEIEVRGQKYKIAPLTIGDIAEFESWVRSKRVQTFLKNADGLPPEERKDILIDLCSKPLGEDTLASEMTSMSGVQYLFWRTLLKHQPDMTLEKAQGLVGWDNLDVLSSVVQNVGGIQEDGEGNPTIPAPTSFGGTSPSASSDTTTE